VKYIYNSLLVYIPTLDDHMHYHMSTWISNHIVLIIV